MVLVRYQNLEDSELTLYKPCYKIKLIDLASLNYLEDIKEYGIKRDLFYPKIYTPYYRKPNFT
jgi:hypothetical protein